MAGPLSLENIIDPIRAGTVKERELAFTNLKPFLRNAARFEAIVGDAAHLLYEALVECANEERAVYLNAKSVSARSAASTRLSTCSSVLRLAIGVGVELMRLRTVMTLINHIFQASLLTSGGFCDPLAIDYARGLRLILAFPPHVEHLGPKEREDVLTFCMKCLQTMVNDVNKIDAQKTSKRTVLSYSSNPPSHLSSSSNTRESSASQSGGSSAKLIAEEVIACLASFTAVPKSMNAVQADIVVSTIINCLRDSAITTRVYQNAFTAINNLLSRTRVEYLGLTRKQVVPLIRLITTFWSLQMSKEMLITLLYLRPYILEIIRDGELITLEPELVRALQAMREEYTKRHERDQLQIEDLRLQPRGLESNANSDICTAIFQLRNAEGKAERHWIMVYVLASLSIALSICKNRQENLMNEDTGAIQSFSRKRRHLHDEIEELSRAAIRGTLSDRLCAIQIITFVAQQIPFTSERLSDSVRSILPNCSDDNGNVASWAFLAMTSLASQKISSTESLRVEWQQAYDIAVRAITNTATCRTACLLLHVIINLKLVSQNSISELIHTLSKSMDLHGPALISESVTYFLSSLCRLSHDTTSAIAATFAESTFSLIFRHFTPSNFPDKTHALQHWTYDAPDLVDLLHQLMNQAPIPRFASYTTWDHVGRAWLTCASQNNILSYLLLDSKQEEFIHNGFWDVALRPQKFPATLQMSDSFARNYLADEFGKIQDAWNRLKDRPQAMSLDVFTFFCNICCIYTSLAFALVWQDNLKQHRVQFQVKALLDSLATYLSSAHCEQNRMDAAMAVCSRFCSGLITPRSLGDLSEVEVLLCRTIFGAAQTRSQDQVFDQRTSDMDLMSLDDLGDSQDSRHASETAGVYTFNNESAAKYSTAALRANVKTYAMIVTQAYPHDSTTRETRDTTADVVENILLLPEPELLLASKIISYLPTYVVIVTPYQSYKLLERCAEQVLGSYNHECSEIALASVLDIITSLARLWTDPTEPELFDLGREMYDWFTNVALRGGALSPSVQSRVATLLLELSSIDTDYGRHDNGTSVRTSLFTLVRLGSISVQYYLSSRIFSVFGLFVLSTHPKIFDDFQQSLPDDSQWIEGMAMRLLFLAELASSWHSLLRNCIYYIFETAARISDTARYAEVCIRTIARKLGYRSCQQLFTLFSPQLLHTWLESHSITTLPFAAFGYSSLRELYALNKEEITAQLLMRGKDSDRQNVGTTLGCTETELVQQSFAKSLAYCICWDIARQQQGVETAESRLRRLMGGKEELRNAAIAHFPTVMGYFFITLQLEDGNEKWLGKHPEYNAVVQQLLEIQKLGQSKILLPPPQQPSFKVKFLIEQISRLCRRTSYEPTQPWTISSFALTVRMLLDTIDPALGPLHTCLVIRRLRLLICLASDISCSGSCVGMLIHSLRPFLSNAQCADDTIGIMHFLLQRGQHNLTNNSLFIRGTITLAILEMNQYAQIQQDNATQESHHRETLHKMHQFRDWLVSYLEQFDAEGNTTLLVSCTKLRAALGQVRLPGNARKGTPESDLLLLLLDQHTNHEEELFQPTDRDHALSLLTAKFQLSETYQDDCIVSDQDCSRYAASIWLSLTAFSLDPNYIVWAAGVLGRAYASTGIHSRRAAIKQSDYKTGKNLDFEGASFSQAQLVQRLCRLLLAPNNTEASLSDYTLRKIVSSLRAEQDATLFENMLPEQLVPAVAGGTFNYVPPVAIDRTLESGSEFTLDVDVSTLVNWSQEKFALNLGLCICLLSREMPFLTALVTMLPRVESFAVYALPRIIHMGLDQDIRAQGHLQASLSTFLERCLSNHDERLASIQRLVVQSFMYLRNQPFPSEKTIADRLRWLDIDCSQAASAAARCKLPATALLLLESITTKDKDNDRRASQRAAAIPITKADVSQDLLLSIFRLVDEPDSFYGVEQSATLSSILGRLDYEADGLKSLMFRSAQNDSQFRTSHQAHYLDPVGIVRSLSMLNLNSINFSLLSSGHTHADANSASLFSTACDLQQWHMNPSEKPSASGHCFTILQALSRSTDRQYARPKLNESIAQHMNSFVANEDIPDASWFATLTSLVEIGELLSSIPHLTLQDASKQILHRQDWMRLSRFDDFKDILSRRHTLFSVLANNQTLQQDLHTSMAECINLEIQALLQISSLSRSHGHLQEALSSAIQIGETVRRLEIDGPALSMAANVETASVLWEMGEQTASVRLLQDALKVDNADVGATSLGRSSMLAQLAHRLAQARLERPEDIMTKYLQPAILHLHGETDGDDAGTVFHEFAVFCDKQLLNPSSLEDFNRIARLRQSKLEEVEQLEQMAKKGRKSSDNAEHKHLLRKAKQWFEIDDTDYQRLKQSRDAFMHQSLENYLLALQATDMHDISVLRFFSLWLEHSENDSANSIVGNHLPSVPSWKFVRLLNQLMSRVESEHNTFQDALQELTSRIFTQHPYHSLHFLYASTRKPQSKEQKASMSRYVKAMEIRQRLATTMGDATRLDLLKNWFVADNLYNILAWENTDSIKGSKVTPKDIPAAFQVASKVPQLRVPPATLHLPLQPDGLYQNVPTVLKFESVVRLMGGLSKPKKMVAVASNGQPYAALFKSGNDDLRQDAIMEQVFEEVSQLLREHKLTRQRNLHVRTYKVIPLMNKSGIIEFVPNSTSLGDFLTPAHLRYHPSDWKPNIAREKISAVKDHSTETRLREFKKVCSHMHPVLRYFFFERFSDPDEWFEKRTAYTRTTASVSILGHVLGLGDRHCQNIMLDEKTGEVIHIDLGVAFEAGRVLPIPELVPFRLTRDVIDGMGITKTEGVFRRCCEFTLDALIRDSDRIMTLLNVLRYDPLYQWTISPLRAKRMQDTTDTDQNAAGGEVRNGSTRNAEAGEADRALSIVEKKLSQTLSTSAAVNELIQQATDERNLATLYSGWTAYF